MSAAKKNARTKRIVFIAMIGLIGLASLYTLAILGYKGDTRTRKIVLERPPPKTDTYMRLEVKVLSADLIQGNMNMRVGFEPFGDLEDENGLLSENLHFLVSSSTGGMDRLLMKGTFANPADVTIELEGTVTDYPWDKHVGGLGMIVTGPTLEGDVQMIPTQVVFFGDLAGLDIGAKITASGDNQEEQEFLAIRITRSPVIQVVVVFSMILLLGLTGTVVAMVIAVLIGNKIEMVMFPFIGTVLFSMIAFRNALPGAPPIGAISDYLAFFWGYALCITALVALTITWLRRLPRKPSLGLSACAPEEVPEGEAGTDGGVPTEPESRGGDRAPP